MKKQIILITICLVLGSCSKPVETVVRTDSKVVPKEVDHTRIKIRDTSLSRRIEVLSVVEGINAGLSKVQVNLRNKSRSPITIQYTFEWLDGDGFNSRPDKVWFTKTLRSGELETLASVADNPRAVDFLFHIKKSDK